MGLELWDNEDIEKIENVLLSLHQATLQAGVDGEYRRGFESALISVALAFGIDLHTMNSTLRLPVSLQEERKQLP